MEGCRVGRLEGLKMAEQQDDHPLYAAVNATLANVAAACSPPPAWYEAWAGLGPQSSKEERLTVYRAVRAAGSLPADAGFFLVAWMLDLLTDERAEEGLRTVEEQLAGVRQKYGIDINTPPDHHPPPPNHQTMPRGQEASAE